MVMVLRNPLNAGGPVSVHEASRSCCPCQTKINFAVAMTIAYEDPSPTDSIYRGRQW